MKTPTRSLSRRLVLQGSLGLMTSGCLLGSSRFVEESVVQSLARFPDLSLTKWSHGSFISVGKADAAVPAFTLADARGVVTTEFKFRLPDTTRVWVHDFDLDATGAVVFCGQCSSSEGLLAQYIAIKSPGSAAIEVIRTAPYVPWLLSVAPDGTIYVAGREHANPDAHVIRHLTRTGTLIASMFAQSEFQGAQQRMVSGYLVATTQKIGWYSPVDMEGVYVEISPDLKSYQKAPGMTVDEGRVLCFTLTESGGAYLTWASGDGKSLPHYKFDRSMSRWTEMALTIQGESIFRLRGQDNGRLVFQGSKATHFITPLAD